MAQRAQRADRLRLDRVEPGGQREEHLSGGQRVAGGVVGSMHREPELARQAREPDRLRARRSLPRVELGGERVGVDHRVAKADPRGQHGSAKEPLLERGDVGDQGPAGEREQQLVEDLAQRRGADQVLAAQAVDADRIRTRHPARAHEAAARAPDPGPTSVDRHRREGDDLVVGLVEAGRLEVEHAETGLPPGGGGFGHRRSQVRLDRRAIADLVRVAQLLHASLVLSDLCTEATALKASRR